MIKSVFLIPIFFVFIIQPIKSQTTYSVEVRTANQTETGSNANGTDANVTIVINGSSGSTTALTLDNSNYNDFESGKTDTYSVSGDDVGTIQSVTISHDNTGKKPGWALEHVKVKKSTQTSWSFCPCRRWLASDEDDGATSRELPVESEVVYHVRVSTCNKDKAGTDANVRIRLIGEDWVSYNRFLDSPGDDFERGSIKTYDLSFKNLGTGNISCYIGHDNAGKNADWCLCEIMITANYSGTDHLWRWTGEQWLKSGALWSPTLILNKEY